jgi:hypothetical protein
MTISAEQKPPPKFTAFVSHTDFTTARLKCGKFVHDTNSGSSEATRQTPQSFFSPLC